MKFRALTFALVGIGIFAVLSWLVGSKLISPTNHKVARPADFEADIVAIPSKDHDIAGWWTDVGHGLPVILLLHAVRADRATMVSRAQLFQKHGFSTLLIDLQAHGETPGTAITFGKRESADVVAAVAWIKNRATHRKIGIVGCSLGGAAALLAPQPLGVDALVLEGVYPRIGPAVENRVRLRLGPLTPVVTPLLFWQLEPRLHLHQEDLEPIRSIAAVGAPVLVAAGSDDEHTTVLETQSLYDAALSEKELWIVGGAKHQDLLAYDPVGYKAHVVRFLIASLRGNLPAQQKLAKADVEQLISEHLTRNIPLVFASNQGVHHCCDLGEPNLQFEHDHRVIAFGDGYVPWMVDLSYDVDDDGTIVLGRRDSEEIAALGRNSGLQDATMYRSGANVYLVQSSDGDPDLSFDPGTTWPFKATREPMLGAPRR